jgi:hypothetical protein
MWLVFCDCLISFVALNKLNQIKPDWLVQCYPCAVVEEHFFFSVSALLMVILTELLTNLLSRCWLKNWVQPKMDYLS